MVNFIKYYLFLDCLERVHILEILQVIYFVTVTDITTQFEARQW